MKSRRGAEVRARWKAGVWGCALLVTQLGCAGPPVRTAGWVVRHELAPSGGPQRVCAAAATAGLDQVLVQVRGRGDAYYRSSFVPPAEALAKPEAGAGSYDPLAETVSTCSGREVTAWLNVFFLWEGDVSPADPRHVANAHPEWLLRDAAGRSTAEYGPLERASGWIEGIYADPASVGYREHFTRVVGEVVRRYPVDGVHLDFVRYPGPDYGQGGAMAEEFAAAWGVDPGWLPEGLRVPDLGAWVRGDLPPADGVLTTAALLWAERRSTQVTALVRSVRELLRTEAPGVRLSAAVFPDAGSAYVAKGQDWPAWAADGLVDALYPMVYFGAEERVRRQLEQVAHVAAADVELWAGLGAYIKSPLELQGEAAVARSLGYDGVCLFDVGSVLRSPAGLDEYVRMVSGARAARVSGSPTAPPRPRTRGGEWLGTIAARAAGGDLPSLDDAGGLLDRRWAEFEAARAVLTETRRSLAGEVRLLPAALDLVGVFRYVHPGDGASRRASQRDLAEQARQRLLAGESPSKVVAALSQGGTRDLGGVLPRRYLWSGDPVALQLRALEEGGVSEVVAVSNGFWVYRVVRREPPRAVAVGDAPWPARRQWFRQALARALGGEEGSVAELDRGPGGPR